MSAQRARVTALVACLAGVCALALAACGGSAPRLCNGLASLCGRSLAAIVFPGTHNSFAASDEPGWRFTSQKYGIGKQLDDGIRALLIDVYFGIEDPARGVVRTDIAASGTKANDVVQAAPPEIRRVAASLGGALGVDLPSTPPKLYLCHVLCEIGSEPLEQELAVLARFLRTHRRVFLVVIVEDYVPAKDIAAAFERAGLAERAVTFHLGQALPTLGSLLDDGKQLAVFSENSGGDPSWYMPAWKFIEDTPLGAKRPSQLSCARARGDSGSPLLLVNHWIPPFPPSPRLNSEIGRYTYLRARVERCMHDRDRDGAIVAVDFYERTSVVDVARSLNEHGG